MKKRNLLCSENAQKAIELFSTPISRQEVFVVPHYFDTKDLFLNHYITSYGNGTAMDEDRQGLLRIIGNKRFNTRSVSKMNA